MDKENTRFDGLKPFCVPVLEQGLYRDAGASWKKTPA